MFKKNDWNPRVIEFFLNANFLERLELYRAIKRYSKNFNGDILDLGCGTKPYKFLFTNSSSYIGLEINGGGIIVQIAFMMVVLFHSKMLALMDWSVFRQFIKPVTLKK